MLVIQIGVLHDITMFSKKYAPIYPVIREAKDTKNVQKKLQNTSNRFQEYWSI